MAKLCKKQCVIRLTPTEFSFINVYNIREGMHMDFRIHKVGYFNLFIFYKLNFNSTQSIISFIMSC